MFGPMIHYAVPGGGVGGLYLHEKKRDGNALMLEFVPMKREFLAHCVCPPHGPWRVIPAHDDIIEAVETSRHQN